MSATVSYVGYCVAIIIALVFTSRAGPRFMVVVAGVVAVVGMAAVAGAPTTWVLALGVLAAGSSSGLASPPMGEAVVRSIHQEFQDRANALITRVPASVWRSRGLQRYFWLSNGG